jgi:hypothetical protein
MRSLVGDADYGGAPWPKDLAVAVKSVRRFAARQLRHS